MTPENFCYWLQGRAELRSEPPTPEEWECIRNHLSLVFNKVTPPGPVKPAEIASNPWSGKPGYDKRTWIEQLNEEARQRTGIPSSIRSQITC